MKNMNEIRHNIKAVEQTRQITNAMYLLSTSHMKKAMMKIDFNKTYLKRIRANVKYVVEQANGEQHRYLEKRGLGRTAFIIVSSDKGLCGSYNINISNLALKKLKECEDPYIVSIGLSAKEILAKYDYKPNQEWFEASQKPSIFYAREIGEHIINLYLKKDIGEAYIIFTRYYNQASQEISCMKLLPLTVEDFSDVEIEVPYADDVLYQPSFKDVFDTLVPQYIIGLIYGALNHASASEHIARMNAMQSATKNADEMIKHLNFEFNTARQLSITNEITEIAAATEIISKAI